MRGHPLDRNAHAMDEPAGPVRYELRVRGLLSEALLGARPSLHAQADGAETVLAGGLPDQAALYGVLTRSRRSAANCSKSVASVREPPPPGHCPCVGVVCAVNVCHQERGVDEAEPLDT